MKKLHILWTSDNPITAHNMVLLYATNSKLQNWWDEVHVIIWGGSAQLVAEDVQIQEKIRLAIQAGVTFSACIRCAQQCNAVEVLESLGVDVVKRGAPLPQILQSGEPFLSV